MTDLTSASSAPTSSPTSDANPPIWTRKTAVAAGAMAALVVAADILFCRHEPGANFALYGFVLIAAVIGLQWRRPLRLRTSGLLVVAVAAQLPMIESGNVLWWPISMLAVSLFSLDASGLLPAFEKWFGVVVRFVVLGPARL